jgi:release factor glutamine methyltransferase
MQIGSYLVAAAAKLGRAGVGTARLDTLVLMEDVLGQDRAWLLAHDDTEIEPGKLVKLEKLLKRRAGHEPLAYIRGHTEFYGRNFVITPAVLEPRPESETMIDLLGGLSATGKLTARMLDKTSSGDFQLKIADVGAGSGALGVTAQLELPQSQKVHVDLLEIDPKAVEIAKMNVDKYTMNIPVVKSDLLSGSTQSYDLLLCNLPYIPDDYIVNKAALQEPKIAIFGGSDGLDIYRRLFRQIKSLLNKPLYILTESLPSQHPALQVIAREHGYQLSQTDDFIQVFTYKQ